MKATTTEKIFPYQGITELVGKYDDTWPGRDYGTGELRRVRFIATDGTVYILHGTNMSDRMKVARVER